MACSMTLATVCRVAWSGLIRSGMAGTATMRSDVPCVVASRAAHSTARTDSGEPSVPAMIGFVNISGPPTCGLLISLPTVARNRPALPSSLGSACPGRWSPAGRRWARWSRPPRWANGPGGRAGPMVPVAGAERLSPAARGKSTVMTVTPAARGRGGGRPVGEWVGIQAVSWDRKTHRRQDGDPLRRHTGPCGGCRRKALRQEAAITPDRGTGFPVPLFASTSRGHFKERRSSR